MSAFIRGVDDLKRKSQVEGDIAHQPLLMAEN